jgi:hypothetical protein
MVWSRKNAKGEDIYIKGSGNFYYITKDKKGALDFIPDGFEVVSKNNKNWFVVRKKE